MKTYYYRKHIIYGAYLFGMVSLFFFGYYIIGKAFNTWEVDAVSLFFGIYFLFFALFFRLFTTTSISVTDNSIIYKRGRKERTILFQDITRITNSTVKYMGGWIKISSSTEKTIRLTVVLKDIDDFTYQLRTNLDNAQLESKYDEMTLFNFYKTSKYSNESWARMYYLFPRLIVVFAIQIAISIVIDIVYEMPWLTVITLLLFAIWTFSYSIIEFVFFARRLAKDTHNYSTSAYDVKKDQKAMNYMLYPYYGITLLITVVTLIITIL